MVHAGGRGSLRQMTVGLDGASPGVASGRLRSLRIFPPRQLDRPRVARSPHNRKFFRMGLYSSCPHAPNSASKLSIMQQVSQEALLSAQLQSQFCKCFSKCLWNNP